MMKNSLMRKYRPQMILLIIIIIEAAIMIGLVQHRSYVIKKQEQQQQELIEQQQQQQQAGTNPSDSTSSEDTNSGSEEVTTMNPNEIPKRDDLENGNAHREDDLRIVCLDAGLGGYAEGDTAKVGSKLTESEYNLGFAQLIKKELNAEGVIVYMTREKDDYVKEDKRTDLANNVYADLMVTLVCDSYDGTKKTEGFSTWVHHNRPANSNQAASEILAELKDAGAVVNEVDAGTFESVNEDYYTNEGCVGPSLVLGMGSVLNNDVVEDYEKNREDYAKAVAKAIVSWLENQGL